MANEANIKASMRVLKGSLDYRSNPTQYLATQTGVGGPTPGTILCAVAPGTDVDLSELTTPGLAVIQNLNATNYVTVGVYDPQSNLFYPMLELLPGEVQVIRLSRNIQEEYATGTGTVGPGTNTLRIIANSAACLVKVDAFEK
jgi:hypothetical protein